MTQKAIINTTVIGTVIGIVPFGAFIMLDNGTKALLHISKMERARKIKHPNNVVKKGDKIQCTVICVDGNSGKIGVSAKFDNDNNIDSVIESEVDYVRD